MTNAERLQKLEGQYNDLGMRLSITEDQLSRTNQVVLQLQRRIVIYDGTVPMDLAEYKGLTAPNPTQPPTDDSGRVLDGK